MGLLGSQARKKIEKKEDFLGGSKSFVFMASCFGYFVNIIVKGVCPRLLSQLSLTHRIRSISKRRFAFAAGGG